MASEAERFVKERYTSARLKEDWPGKWTVRKFTFGGERRSIIGEGVSPDAAWADAARRVREAEEKGKP